MNILILHAHWSNRGDEAALRAMIDSLRAHLPVEKMCVMIVGFRVEQFPYDDIERIELYPNIWLKVERLEAVVNVFAFGKLVFTRRGREFIRAVNEADMVIHAPGGPTIGDLNALGDLHYLYRLLVAKVFKRKPLFFYAPSMGPFSGWIRNQARKFVLRRADAIILRDEISLGYLRDQLGLDAYVTLDSAFQNDVPDDYLEKYDNIAETLQLIEGTRAVGMVVTDLKWYPKYMESQGLAEKIMACCSDVVKHLLDKGYFVLLIPQLFGAVDDVQLLETIREVDKDRILICPPNIDSYGQQVLIAKLFALISMRYHPVVFAAKANTPFISIYYEHKAEGFARRAGFADFAIHVENLVAGEIIDRFTILERDHNALKEQLSALNPVLKEESRETTRIIVDKLMELGWTTGG